MLEGDLDTCVQMAKDQVKEGAHVLDLCVDYVGRDGTADMDELAKLLATQASVPLVLDSTEAPVLEAGLQWLGGRAILNSANLEDGDAEGSRFDQVMKLAKEYGAAVICLLIDEEGQARDVEWKMRVAHRIHDLAVDRYGLEPGDLIFDALTFPLSTGDDDLRGDAMATIEAIRRIKAELPGVFTTLGVSNVSFGLKPAARHVLNSVFLHECVQAGLDSAIVHAARIMPLNKIPDGAARGLPRPGLRPPHATTTTPSPPSSTSSPTSRPPRSSGRTAATGPSSSCSANASSTASAKASRPTSTGPWPRASPRWRSSTTCCSPG